MKKSIDIVRQLEKYFNVKVIGSQLLVDRGLLNESETKDIDIIVRVESEYQIKALEFLKDNGFTESLLDGARKTSYKNENYDKEIDIHFSRELHVNVFSIPELIKEKLKRGYVDDLNHIKAVVEHKLNQNGEQ